LIICRITNNEHFQVAYLDDNGGISPESLQVKISPKELVHLESFLNRGLKRIETSFNEALFDTDVIAEGQYCICIYHTAQKAVVTIRGETIKLNFSVLSDLKDEVNKLVKEQSVNNR
jgi:hypothetical protein